MKVGYRILYGLSCKEAILFSWSYEEFCLSCSEDTYYNLERNLWDLCRIRMYSRLKSEKKFISKVGLKTSTTVHLLTSIMVTFGKIMIIERHSNSGHSNSKEISRSIPRQFRREYIDNQPHSHDYDTNWSQGGWTFTITIGREHLVSFISVTFKFWCWVPRESVLRGSSAHKAMRTAQNLKVTLIELLLKLTLLALHQVFRPVHTFLFHCIHLSACFIQPLLHFTF